MKILVIAQSEAKAVEAEKVLNAIDSTLKIKKVHLGVKSVPRHFEAVVVYLTTNNEANFIKDEIQRYSEAPIKAYMSKSAPVYPDAASKKSQAFLASQAENLLAYVK